jgi:hypothetical protein
MMTLRDILPHMTTWLFLPAVICLLALVAIAQWLDWEFGIQGRQLNCHYRRRAALSSPAG